MSATSHRLTFGALISDPDHWTPEHCAQADAAKIPDSTGDEWVIARLDAVMRAAGDQFIREHPDLFAVDQLI